MKRLTREQILGANDIRTKDVLTPEWAPDGCTEEERAQFGVTVRNLTGEGRGLFIQTSLEMKRKTESKEQFDFEVEMLLVLMTAVDENNKLLFSREDLDELKQKSADPISRCAAAATKLSGLNPEAQVEAGKA